MSPKRVLISGFALALTLPPLFALAVPLPTGGGSDAITDHGGFFPHRKHPPLPGKAVGVLLADAQPVLNAEGRSGPPDQLCFGRGGASYRWVYVSAPEGRPTIGTLRLPVADGSTRAFDNLSMASPAAVKHWEIAAPYALVEVEVNAGLGSPAGDAFVATKMKQLDGTDEYPLKVAEVVAELRKRYDGYLSEQGATIDTALNGAARKALKGAKLTGPRERRTLMFLSWLPGQERLLVRFRTRVTDGAYRYANGIKIDLGVARPRPGPARGGDADPPKLPHGLRYGTLFGVELGMYYQVDKTGKLVRARPLSVEPFQEEIPEPPVPRRPANP
ncbi:MAG TPA: hypothetical protein VIL46_02225 [Gemmataceae bacterium]